MLFLGSSNFFTFSLPTVISDLPSWKCNRTKQSLPHVINCTMFVYSASQVLYCTGSNKLQDNKHDSKHSAKNHKSKKHNILTNIGTQQVWIMQHHQKNKTKTKTKNKNKQQTNKHTNNKNKTKPKQNKTKQNKKTKTKQNKTKQNKTKQNKTKQNKTKQNKAKNKTNKNTLLSSDHWCMSSAVAVWMMQVNIWPWSPHLLG